MRLILVTCVLWLAACAAEPGIVPAGQDTFMASRSGKFYVSMTDVRAAVLREAGDFCEKRNMTFAVISTQSTQPPYIVGNNPEIEIQFRCVSHEFNTAYAEKADH
jgi:hypothetical protein